MNKKSLRYDILKELFNISVGKAASMLSEIVNKKILLNVPNLQVLKSNEYKPKLEEYIPKFFDGTLLVSSIKFNEKLTGEANLIFPADKKKTLVDLCLKGEQIDESDVTELSDVDYDIIKEIGNIILNSIIGGVGDYLQIKLNYSLPEVKVYNKINFEKDVQNKSYDYVIILYITFNIDGTEIVGAIIIDLTLNSLNELIEKIDDLEDAIDE